MRKNYSKGRVTSELQRQKLIYGQCLTCEGDYACGEEANTTTLSSGLKGNYKLEFSAMGAILVTFYSSEFSAMGAYWLHFTRLQRPHKVTPSLWLSRAKCIDLYSDMVSLIVLLSLFKACKFAYLKYVHDDSLGMS